jgi:hypothetical protein
MQTLKFEVLPPNAAWFADGQEFLANDNERLLSEGVEADDAFVRLAHHAHAAGVIRIEGEADVAAHGVQSQEDGEAALAEAQGEWIAPEYAEGGGIVAGTGRWSGPWHEDNAALHEQTKAAMAEEVAAVEAENQGGDE